MPREVRYAMWASWAVLQNPASQKGPMLEDYCVEGNIVKFLKILFLNLCFLSEVNRIMAHTLGVWRLPPCFPHRFSVSSSLFPGPHLGTPADDHCCHLPREAIGLHLQGAGDCGQGLIFSFWIGPHKLCSQPWLCLLQ